MIGSTIYIFEDNHRVYAKDAQGRSTGGPIWKEHWRPHTIDGETTQSWIVGKDWRNPIKISKKELREGTLRGVCFSMEEVERKAWVKANAHYLGNVVGVQDNYELLKKIAEMVNYKEQKP
jgi:hypothetical protein